METNSKAKTLRKNQTKEEKKLWKHLRNNNFFNLKFRRQFLIENYIVDFVCLEKRLVIELDGNQHGFENNKTKDKIRDEVIAKNNFKILRFWNSDLKNIESVLETIARECNVLN
jgi:very-short-patch-repair endonuclease